MFHRAQPEEDLSLEVCQDHSSSHALAAPALKLDPEVKSVSHDFSALEALETVPKSRLTQELV